MTPRDFVYWLQGYVEIENPTALTEVQTQIIKDHLQLVFKKETPDRRPRLSDAHLLNMDETKRETNNGIVTTTTYSVFSEKPLNTKTQPIPTDIMGNEIKPSRITNIYWRVNEYDEPPASC